MPHEDKIQEILTKLENISGQLDNIRLQQGIFESRFESEQGTVKRRHEEFDKRIDNIRDIIYNRETGIAFELDRLKQSDKKRNENGKILWGLIVVVSGILIKMLVEWVSKK